VQPFIAAQHLTLDGAQEILFGRRLEKLLRLLLLLVHTARSWGVNGTGTSRITPCGCPRFAIATKIYLTSLSL
jgi:hypothetical protein